MPYQLSEYSAGIGDNLVQPNTAYYDKSPAPVTPPSSGFSFGNLAHSIGAGVSGAANFIGHSFVDPVVTGIKAIGQGLPVVGSIQRNQDNYQQRGNSLDNALHDAVQAYKSTDPKVKISKDEFHKRVNDIQAATAQLSLENERDRQSYVSPGDAAKALFESGLMFTGFGELGAAGGAAAGAEEGATGIAGALGKANKLAEGLYNKIPGVSLKAAAEAGAAEPGLISTLAKGALKYPLVTKPNIEFPGQIVNDVKTGNYKDLATQAAFIGGGHAAMALPDVLGAASKATFGEKGVLSEVFGNRIQQFLKDRPDLMPVAKQMQQFTLNHTGGSTEDAVNFLRSHLKDEVGIDPTKADLATEFKRAANFYNERLRLQDAVATAAKDGVKLPQNPVISHAVDNFRGKFKYAVDEQLRQNGLDFTNLDHRKQIVESVLNDPNGRLGNIKDETLKNKLGDALLNSNTKEDFRQALQDVTQKTPVNVPGFRPAKGFVVTRGPKSVTAVPDLASSGELKFTKAPNRALAPIGNALTKVGLSPVDQGGRTTQGLIKDSFTKKLAGKDYPDSPSDLYSRVMGISTAAKFNYDPRTLSITELKNGLGADYTRQDAKDIFKAVTGAYSDLPVSRVGIGPKIINKTIEALPAEGKYLRLQGVGKFSLNPFFYGKQVAKTAVIAAAEGGNLFKKPSADTAKFLEQHGFFSKNLRDAGVADFLETDVHKGIDKIGAVQQHLMGSLAQTLADQHGKSLSQIWQEGGQLKNDIQHALTVTIGYPKGGYLASPLAKTLNVLIFPSRFETKVALEAGKWLSRQNPVTRVALLHDVANLRQQLDSPEGRKWQSDNSEAIGLLKYFTPLKTITDVMKASGEGNASDLGEIGGLPFGVLQTILQHQGITKQAPYQDPKTGKISNDKIPVTAKGRVQAVMTDLISSTFGYPGRQAGFTTSKTDLVSGLPGLKRDSKDFVSVDRSGDASASQRQYAADVAPTNTKPNADSFLRQLGSVTPGKLPGVSVAAPAPIFKSGGRSTRAPKVKRFARSMPKF